MVRRFLGAYLVVLAFCSMAYSADYRQEKDNRDQEAGLVARGGYAGYMFMDCENGDTPFVLSCQAGDPEIPVSSLSAQRSSIELSIARRKRPYQELFNWSR